MTYLSEPLPLEFWNRLLPRLTAEFDSQRFRLNDLLQARAATVDTAPLVINQVSHARQEALALLAELEQVQALLLTVTQQAHVAMFNAGAHDLRQRIACLRNVVGLFEATMCGLPPRGPVEQELAFVAEKHQTLRNAGHSDALNTERQRLCAATYMLPVVGREEGEDFEDAVRSLRTSIDQMEAQLQAAQAHTMLSVQASEAQARLLVRFGVAMVLANAPAERVVEAEAAPEPTETPAETE